MNFVSPNTTTTTLDAAIISTNTTISVANTSNFVNFEGTAVSGTNLGYVLVNDEIISYSQVNVGSITINARGENESTVRNHAVNDIIRKYELNGISLTRINNSHNLPTDQSISSRRDIDSYHIQIQRPGTKNSGANLLNFDGEGSFGGDLCRATQNIQFNEVLPYFNVINPEGTSVSSTLRTVSGTSVGGNESSFQDLGYESVALNRVNEFSSPRIVCSRVNETERLSTLPRSKSLTLGVRMETTNNSISPSVSLDERVFPSKVKLSTLHWSTLGKRVIAPVPPGLPLFSVRRTGTKPFAGVVGLSCPATNPGAMLKRSV